MRGEVGFVSSANGDQLPCRVRVLDFLESGADRSWGYCSYRLQSRPGPARLVNEILTVVKAFAPPVLSIVETFVAIPALRRSANSYCLKHGTGPFTV